MSKYVILRLNNKTNPYTSYKGKPSYGLFFHTNTKYANNEPYFSTSLNKKTINKYSINKEEIPSMLKLAQNHVPSYGKRKEVKRGKIFILKVNSPKLETIINLYK